MNQIRTIAMIGLLLKQMFCIGQIGDSHIKETWDYTAEKKPYSSTSVGLTDYALQVDPYATYGYGEALGFAEEGYVVMYEVTKDKAYLIHSLNQFLRAIAWRQENFRFNNSLYKDGVLLWAMAHWINVVLSDPEIYNSILDMDLVDQVTSTNPNNVLPYLSMSTYDDVARWLLARSVETLDAIIAAHWSHDLAFSTYGGLNGLNQEVGFAGALLHLGHLSALSSSFSGLASYLDKGARMAVLLKQSLHINDRCNCALFSGPILQFDAPSNSYWWYHAGWDVSTTGSCIGDCAPPWFLPYFDEPNAESYMEYLEDVSHAILSLQLPLVASRISLYTGGNYPFSDTEMVKFRNMFTKKIYAPDANGKFNNSVQGTIGPIFYEENQPSAYFAKDFFRSQMFGYARLFRYDELPGVAAGATVYSILSEEYLEQGPQLTGSFTGGIHIYGLAEFVASHWEKECFSLDLYNRDLVYDQDFAAKNVLRVVPDGEAGASFADPVITEPRFTVNNGVRSTFRAGAAVVFEPGFEAVQGSVVEAVIDPLGCDLTYKSLDPPVGQRVVVKPVEESDPPSEAIVESITTEQVEPARLLDQLRLIPNPTASTASALLQIPEERAVLLIVHDAIGRKVWSGNFGTLPAGEHRLPLGLLPSTGFYYCTAWLDNVPLSERLIVE